MASKVRKEPKANIFAFLINLLRAMREYIRYNRSVRFMRQVHFNNDFIIYCVKKAAWETSLGQRLSITLETAAGKITIAVDTDQDSPSLTREDELYQDWKNARENKG